MLGPVVVGRFFDLEDEYQRIWTRAAELDSLTTGISHQHVVSREAFEEEEDLTTANGLLDDFAATAAKLEDVRQAYLVLCEATSCVVEFLDSVDPFVERCFEAKENMSPYEDVEEKVSQIDYVIKEVTDSEGFEGLRRFQEVFRSAKEDVGHLIENLEAFLKAVKKDVAKLRAVAV